MRRYAYYTLDFGENKIRDPDLAVLPASAIKWLLSDELILRFTFIVSKGQGAREAMKIEDNAELQIGIKAKRDYATLLAYEPNSRWDLAADWEESNRHEGRVSCRLNLHKVPLIGKIGSSPSLEVLVDVCITEPGEPPSTIQFGATILNDALKLDQGDAGEATPDLATKDYVDAQFNAIKRPPEGFYRLGAKLLLWDIELEDYFPVALVNGSIVVLDE